MAEMLHKDFTLLFPWKYLLSMCQNIWTLILVQEQNFQIHRDYYSHILIDNTTVLEISSAATSRDKNVILFHSGTIFFFFQWLALEGGMGTGEE